MESGKSFKNSHPPRRSCSRFERPPMVGGRDVKEVQYVMSRILREARPLMVSGRVHRALQIDIF